MSATLTTLALTLVPAGNIAEFLKARELPVPEETEKAFDLALKASGVKTQGEFSALMVNLTKGEISGANLTEALKLAFPTDKVGDRHGPYYLSLCRTGKIKTDFAPAKKTATTKAAATVDPRIEAMTAEIENLKARITAALEAKSLKEAKAALES